MRALIGWAGVLPIFAFAACAPLACETTAIVVVKKEERARPETPPGLRTTETGRVEELPMVVVRDYWVKSEDGRWHRVSVEKFNVAEAGGRLEICR